jgi:hypothetical protein
MTSFLVMEANMVAVTEFRAKMPRWRKSSATLLREVRDAAL